MKEIWKPVVGYEGFYEVSNIGKVRSLARIVECNDGRKRKLKTRILRQSCAPSGYYMVTLHKNGKQKSGLVHRLVCEAFIPKPLGKDEVNHKDENSKNNNATNLEWVTAKENNTYGTRQERARKAIVEAQGRAVRQLSRDGELVAEYESLSAAGNATGTHVPNIIKCAKGIYKTAGGYIWKYKNETTKGK